MSETQKKQTNKTKQQDEIPDAAHDESAFDVLEEYEADHPLVQAMQETVQTAEVLLERAEDPEEWIEGLRQAVLDSGKELKDVYDKPLQNFHFMHTDEDIVVAGGIEDVLLEEYGLDIREEIDPEKLPAFEELKGTIEQTLQDNLSNPEEALSRLAVREETNHGNEAYHEEFEERFRRELGGVEGYKETIEDLDLSTDGLRFLYASSLITFSIEYLRDENDSET